jgi:serine protease Do
MRFRSATPLALALLATLASPAAAQQQRAPQPNADSVARANDAYQRALEVELRRVREQLQTIRLRMEETDTSIHVVNALREAESKLRLNQRELERALMTMRSRTRSLNRVPAGPVNFRAPPGWIGVTFSGSVAVMSSSADGPIMKYADYPVIESVSPGSPASRAGLEAGDTIIAYNGDDLRKREVVLHQLLRPGSKVRMSVRRAGTTREVAVLVAPRPQRFGTVAPAAEAEVAVVDPVAPRGVGEGSGQGAAAGASGARTPRAPRAPVAVRVLVPPTAEGLVVRTTTAGIAGAECVRLSEELGEAFGVKRGVLVLNVGGGTPAERSGLRGGDVIVAANGSTITTPDDFVSAVRRAYEADRRTVTLDIVRKKKRQSIDLRW